MFDTGQTPFRIHQKLGYCHMYLTSVTSLSMPAKEFTVLFKN